MNYPSVCLEKLHPFERYRVSAGPDTGYGATLGVFESLQEAREYAYSIGDLVFMSPTIEREISQEAQQ